MWHKLTPLFAKTAFERIALVNNHWNHFGMIQKIESGAFKPPILRNVSPIEDYYIHFSSSSTNKIVKLMEYNGPTPFYPLVEKGVDVHVYKKGEHLHTQSQSDPDNVFDFKETVYEDKRTHGMDNKAYENPREFESRIFSNLSKHKYIEGLTNLESLIRENIIDLTQDQLKHIGLALNKLKNTCEDLIEHQKTWAQTLHHFPDRYIPSMKIPKNFCIDDLKPEFKIQLEQAHNKMQKISDYLFKQKLPENDYKRAIEFFEDSFIQELFK